MARTIRKTSATGIYHVMLRGNNRQIIFNSDKDKASFLEILKDCKQSNGFKLYAFCLMNNHIHLLYKEGPKGISHDMRCLAGRYAQDFNRKHGRSGYLFQGRFRSEAVEDSSYLSSLLKYIHFNPVKAGLSMLPEDYAYSSCNSLLKAAGLRTGAVHEAVLLYAPMACCRRAIDILDLIDWRELFELMDADNIFEDYDDFGKEDEIDCLDTPEDKLIMNTEDSLYKYTKLSCSEFKTKNTREKKSIIDGLYSMGFSMRKIGKLTELSTTYVSRLLWID